MGYHTWNVHCMLCLGFDGFQQRFVDKFSFSSSCSNIGTWMKIGIDQFSILVVPVGRLLVLPSSLKPNTRSNSFRTKTSDCLVPKQITSRPQSRVGETL